MDSDFRLGSLIKALLVIVIVLIVVAVCDFYIASDIYKRGQIDALSGKVKYELQTQQDSTHIWVKREEK